MPSMKDFSRSGACEFPTDPEEWWREVQSPSYLITVFGDQIYYDHSQIVLLLHSRISLDSSTYRLTECFSASSWTKLAFWVMSCGQNLWLWRQVQGEEILTASNDLVS